MALVNPASRLRQTINRLADCGGGVHETNETGELREEREKRALDAAAKK